VAVYANAKRVAPVECFAVANAAVSGSTSYYTRKFDVGNVAGAAFHTFSNGASGQWVPEVSNKPRPNEASSADWVDITDRITPAIDAVTSGTPATQWISLGGLEAKWCRLKWTNNGTTAVPFAYFAAKEPA
jgi:hypothetical protein